MSLETQVVASSFGVRPAVAGRIQLRTFERLPVADRPRGSPLTTPLPHSIKARKHASKLTERSWNVHENKGSLWKTWERSGNVYENKAT
jgi:hypothetical protein